MAKQIVFEDVARSKLKAGVDALANTVFDAVICDIRPPRVDGLRVLREAARCQPTGIRLATAAAVDREELFELLPEVHHILNRPWNSHDLLDTLRRTFAQRDQVGEESVVAILGKVRKLPNLPAIYHELVTTLKEDEVSLARVARIVRRDPAITAQLLKMVNSAFFGLKRHVNSIETALRFLGIETFKTLVLGQGGRRPAAKRPPPPAADAGSVCGWGCWA